MLPAGGALQVEGWSRRVYGQSPRPQTVMPQETVRNALLPFLDEKGLAKLRLTCRGAKGTVDDRRLDRATRVRVLEGKKQLSLAERVEISFLKFHDRSLCEKTGIVALCILLSPVILGYNLPTILQHTYTRVVEPIRCFVHKKILIPLCEAVKAVTKFFFVTVPDWVYQHTLVPGYQKLCAVGQWFYHNWALPVARCIRTVATVVFNYLKSAYQTIYDTVLVHLEGGLRRIIVYVAENILFPLVEKCVRYFLTLSIEVLKGVFRAIHWSCTKLMNAAAWSWEKSRPAISVIRAVAKGLFYTFPCKVWMHLCVPVLNAAWKASVVVFEYLLKPIGYGIQWGGRFVLNVVNTLATAILNNLVIPITEGIREASLVLYRSVLSPAGSLIAMVPQLIRSLGSR